jgi:hypothetical protein
MVEITVKESAAAPAVQLFRRRRDSTLKAYATNKN